MNMDLQGEGWRVFAGSCLDRLRELPDGSVDAVVTDPPYGLSNTDPGHVSDALVRWVSGERDFIPDGKGFMGKAWDAFVPPPAVWDECLRVLKPGGHVLAFAGSRTFDLMALSIRLAGFEIRDSVAWLYGSGFPKSLDVSKAIDKGQGENRDRQLKFTAWMRSTGVTQNECAEAILGFAKNLESARAMAQHYFSNKQQPAIATADVFDAMRHLLPEVPEEIERLVAERTGIEWTAYKNREVIGTRVTGAAMSSKTSEASATDFGSGQNVVDVTAPATPEAQQWQGWGTALKPAFEPVVVARKPLIGTVAENVLLHGTGGLNIDGTRIGTEQIVSRGGRSSSVVGDEREGASLGMYGAHPPLNTVHSGRWPSNVMLDEFTAGLVDEQSGVSKSTPSARKEETHSEEIYGKGLGNWSGSSHSDSGGASRFFYVAKASKRDRNEGLEELPIRRPDDRTETGMGSFAEKGVQPGRNFHPTVKPTDLMRQLVRLVTPPGGVVLDPFTGSGSTGKAAILEGFEFIGVELTDEYLPIIEGRLSHAVTQRAQAESDAVTAEAETLF
jgi:DNA modification methylase